jgi:cell division FtsZ-interacting protein ZapD
MFSAQHFLLRKLSTHLGTYLCIEVKEMIHEANSIKAIFRKGRLVSDLTKDFLRQQLH